MELTIKKQMRQTRKRKRFQSADSCAVGTVPFGRLLNLDFPMSGWALAIVEEQMETSLAFFKVVSNKGPF